MGINFKGLAGKTQTPMQSSGVSAPPKSGISFLKTGAAAKAAVMAEAAKAEARKMAQGKMKPFKMPYNSDKQITFLDGVLDATGTLEVPRFFQHVVQIGGDWRDFICTADIDTSQPCPLCESGNKPSLVGVMTVIDHSSFTATEGPNAGKTYQHMRRLFIAKEGTLASLQKLAQKPERNGLALCTFDVSRGPESKHPPRVGDTFDFVMKHKSLADLAAAIERDIEDVQPAIYEGENGEFNYLPPEKLIEMGFGKAPAGVGYEKGVSFAKGEL